jgi:putative sigma-54 modulation protein
MTLRIDLTDRHEQHPEEVRDYAREKVEKLARYFDQVQHIEIVLDKEHEDHCVEVIVSANHNMHFVGHAMNHSVMACIDRVVEKLERQVVKAKERLKDHHRGQSAKGNP